MPLTPSPMWNLLLVMIGGAIGSGARHLTGRAMLHALGPNYPFGTMTVNLVGGLIMGLLIGALVRFGGNENVRLFVAVGILGGYTTFSSFALDVANMIERGQAGAALGYVLISVIGSVLAVFAGLMLTRAIPA